MCNPAVFVAMGAEAATAATLSAVTVAATTAAGVANSYQQQENMVETRENQAEAAVVDYNISQKNLENEAISQLDVTENELFNANIEAARARSSAKANAGSKGITGNTVTDLSNDVDSTIGRSLSEINLNQDIAEQSMQSQSDSSYRSLQSALTGLSEGVQGPSAIGSALQIGGAYAGAKYSATKELEALNDGYIKK